VGHCPAELIHDTLHTHSSSIRWVTALLLIAFMIHYVHTHRVSGGLLPCCCTMCVEVCVWRRVSGGSLPCCYTICVECVCGGEHQVGHCPAAITICVCVRRASPLHAHAAPLASHSSSIRWVTALLLYYMCGGVCVLRRAFPLHARAAPSASHSLSIRWVTALLLYYTCGRMHSYTIRWGLCCC
jgi:hypothetical protein